MDQFVSTPLTLQHSLVNLHTSKVSPFTPSSARGTTGLSRFLRYPLDPALLAQGCRVL